MDADGLILASQTLPPGTPLTERIDVAAAAGFAGLGLRPRDRQEALAAGETDATLRARLAERGVEVVEIEVLRDWGVGEERAREFEESLYELVDALGGTYLIAVGEIDGDAATVARRFAAVCDRAAEHGLRVAIEFVPYTTIPDAGSAWEIVERADRPNGGLLVDPWHWFRGRPDRALLEPVPPERIFAVHFDDAEAEPLGSLVEDTRHHRRLPGEGAFDLGGFVQMLDAHGVRVPYSVEVLSDELHARPAADCARAAAETTRAVLSEARRSR
jgi:sugar phosphate isomerase/epimerase